MSGYLKVGDKVVLMKTYKGNTEAWNVSGKCGVVTQADGNQSQMYGQPAETLVRVNFKNHHQQVVLAESRLKRID